MDDSAASTSAISQVAERPEGRSDTPPGRTIVVIGASAGGMAALQQLLGALPSDYGGSIFVVMHVPTGAPPLLAGILGRTSALRITEASDDASIEPGCVYIAPADFHVLVEHGVMRLIHGPRENRHRPAIDPLFRSAAWTYGPKVVGIVLTGQLDDGTAGLWAVKSCGGTTVVQEPNEAEFPEMPMNALRHNRIDHRLPLDDIAKLLVELAKAPLPHGHRPEPPPEVYDEIEAVKFRRELSSMDRMGALSPFTCPSCRGALWELEHDGHLRYRCHTGHGFTLPTLKDEQTEAIETSLYSALRALEEKAEALRRLANNWPDNLPAVKQDYQRRAQEVDRSAEILRSLLAAGRDAT